MSYRIDVRPPVRQAIRSWGLSDAMLIEVYLRLEGIDQGQLVRVRDPFEGMAYAFSMVDPENRLCHHIFIFQVAFSQDEQTLIVAKAGHHRRMGV